MGMALVVAVQVVVGAMEDDQRRLLMSSSYSLASRDVCGSETLALEACVNDGEYFFTSNAAMDVEKVCGTVALLKDEDGCGIVTDLDDACGREFLAAMRCLWSNLCDIDLDCTVKTKQPVQLLPKWAVILPLVIVAVLVGFTCGGSLAFLHDEPRPKQDNFYQPPTLPLKHAPDDDLIDVTQPSAP